MLGKVWSETVARSACSRDRSGTNSRLQAGRATGAQHNNLNIIP